ncbi:hypothetical protein K420107F6_19370 [Lactonifactor longoviformis]
MKQAFQIILTDFDLKEMQKQATENMKKEFTKIWYVVYADIHGNFDKMNLEILLELLKCRISDRRHVKLCRQCYSQNY